SCRYHAGAGGYLSGIATFRTGGSLFAARQVVDGTGSGRQARSSACHGAAVSLGPLAWRGGPAPPGRGVLDFSTPPAPSRFHGAAIATDQAVLAALRSWRNDPGGGRSGGDRADHPYPARELGLSSDRSAQRSRSAAPVRRARERDRAAVDGYRYAGDDRPAT